MSNLIASNEISSMCEGSCKPCKSDFYCETGKNGAYKDADKCGCKGPKYIDPTIFEKVGKYACTVPPGKSDGTVKACNQISTKVDTCKHKTKQGCTGLGASGKQCLWYDPSNGAKDGGQGVCYDSGNDGFFANCDADGYMCDPASPSSFGSQNCGEVWVPTPGNETCVCDGNAVSWSAKIQLGPNITAADKETLYDKILADLNNPDDNDLSNIQLLSTQNNQVYPPETCKRNVIAPSQYGYTPAPPTSSTSHPSPIAPNRASFPHITPTTTPISSGNTPSSERVVGSIFPPSWGTPPNGGVWRSRSACNAANNNACKNIAGKGILSTGNYYVNPALYSWYALHSMQKPTPPKPVDCVVSEWKDVGVCTRHNKPVKCGGGYQKQTRSIITNPEGGGIACGSLTRNIRCAEQPCETHIPQNCQFTNWSEWSDCEPLKGHTCSDSKSDINGQRTRHRYIKTPAKHDGECVGETTQTVHCTVPCPVDCKVSWSACNQIDGTQTATITKEQNGGKPCIIKTGDTKPCKVDCKLSEWSDDWSQCSRRCGGGEQTKTRSVTQKPKNGGAACGNTTMTQSCNTQPCTEQRASKEGESCGGGEENEAICESGLVCMVTDSMPGAKGVCASPSSLELPNIPFTLYCHNPKLRGNEAACQAWGCTYQPGAEWDGDTCQGATYMERAQMTTKGTATYDWFAYMANQANKDYPVHTHQSGIYNPDP